MLNKSASHSFPLIVIKFPINLLKMEYQVLRNSHLIILTHAVCLLGLEYTHIMAAPDYRPKKTYSTNANPKEWRDPTNK